MAGGGESVKMGPYNAEDRWHLGLASEKWAVGELGDRVWLTAHYICKREGRMHHIEMGQAAATKEGWIGISLEYWYLAITGTYVRNRWISHFDLFESMMWRNIQQMRTEKPERSGWGEMGLVRDESGNVAESPLLITTESLIRNISTPHSEAQVQEIERYGGKRMNWNIHPTHGMLWRSRIGKAISDMWLEDGEIDDDLGELANMFYRNQLGDRDSQCVCEKVGDFPRGVEVLRSLRNGRMRRRATIDIEDISRRAGIDSGSRENAGRNPVRIINGRGGGY